MDLFMFWNFVKSVFTYWSVWTFSLINLLGDPKWQHMVFSCTNPDLIQKSSSSSFYQSRCDIPRVVPCDTPGGSMESPRRDLKNTGTSVVPRLITFSCSLITWVSFTHSAHVHAVERKPHMSPRSHSSWLKTDTTVIVMDVGPRRFGVLLLLLNLYVDRIGRNNKMSINRIGFP